MSKKYHINPYTGKFDAYIGNNFEISSTIDYDLLQYKSGEWVNQQDLEILGTGNIILKSGQKLIFDG